MMVLFTVRDVLDDSAYFPALANNYLQSFMASTSITSSSY